MLVSSSADKTIKIFKAADLTEIKTYDWPAGLGSVAGSSRRTARVSPAGTTSSIADGLLDWKYYAYRRLRGSCEAE